MREFGEDTATHLIRANDETPSIFILFDGTLRRSNYLKEERDTELEHIETINDKVDKLIYNAKFREYIAGDCFGSLEALGGPEWEPSFVYAEENSKCFELDAKKAKEIVKKIKE